MSPINFTTLLNSNSEETNWMFRVINTIMMILLREHVRESNASKIERQKGFIILNKYMMARGH